MTDRSIDEFLGGYKSPRITVPIQQRADLLEEHGRLCRQRDRAMRESQSLAGAPSELAEQIEAIEAEMLESTFELTFEALSSHQFLRLKAKHRPRKEDREQRLDFNMDTFPPALFAACAVDPVMTEDQAETLVQKVNDGQFAKIWNAVLILNIGDDTAPKSVMPSGQGATSSESSTTAASGGSLAQSS